MPRPPDKPRMRSPSSLVERTTDPRRLLADRAARWLVVGGGLAIILSILGILLFILAEVWPLAGRPTVLTAGRLALPPGTPLAILADEHRTHLATIGAEGTLRVSRWVDGRTVLAFSLLTDGAGTAVRLTAAAPVAGPPALAATSSDGRMVIVRMAWDVTFEGDHRRVAPRIEETLVLDFDATHRSLGAFAATVDESGGALAAVQLADRSVVLAELTSSENPITGERTRSVRREVADATGRRLTALVLDPERRNLYGGTDRGEILWWQLRDGRAEPPRVLGRGSSPVSALNLLLGGRSLVEGREDGSIAVWSQRRPEAGGPFELCHLRDLPRRDTAIRRIAPSPRDKGFLVLDARGGVSLLHSTSARELWTGPSPAGGAAEIVFAPKADGAIVAGEGQAASLDVRNPHPEVSLRSLFGRVWYEGYPAPDFVWQSTGGTDDFEPKLSLTPLVLGTLKGTFYSLLLAIPLGVLGAMYASQFMHPRLKHYVKPTVEIMAALPSVVLGFLAGLWLAPLVETAFLTVILLGVVLPAAVLTAGLAWRTLPLSVRNRAPVGSELGLYFLALVVGAVVCHAIEPEFERVAFGGSFQGWLATVTGLTYDQRNAIVVGLAMGFAVIPIVFAISEDAFTNVPRNLVSGSLALGANRWQTVTRVVLPTASPGIFSAIMIGFGRAVGETMIVLMATGNTPILSFSPFNGFRTLSANIAVEISEAPVGSTLYRTLFLAALLLFVVTFAVNTAAELVRQRLRRRYAQL